MSECRCEEAKLIYGPVRRTVKGEIKPLEPKSGWHRAHDCRYVADRNALIPEAERLATQETLHMPEGHKESEWSRAFLTAMDELWRTRNAC